MDMIDDNGKHLEPVEGGFSSTFGGCMICTDYASDRVVQVIAVYPCGSSAVPWTGTRALSL